MTAADYRTRTIAKHALGGLVSGLLIVGIPVWLAWGWLTETAGPWLASALGL